MAFSPLRRCTCPAAVRHRRAAYRLVLPLDEAGEHTQLTDRVSILDQAAAPHLRFPLTVAVNPSVALLDPDQ